MTIREVARRIARHPKVTIPAIRAAGILAEEVGDMEMDDASYSVMNAHNADVSSALAEGYKAALVALVSHATGSETMDPVAVGKRVTRLLTALAAAKRDQDETDDEEAADKTESRQPKTLAQLRERFGTSTITVPTSLSKLREQFAR